MWFDLEQALDLLAVLEDARDTLIDNDLLVAAMPLEAHITTLSNSLELYC